MKPTRSVWIKIPQSDETWGMYRPPGPQRWVWIRVQCRAGYRKAYGRMVKEVGRMRAHEYMLIPGRDDEEIG
jgi:hypothetical protein